MQRGALVIFVGPPDNDVSWQAVCGGARRHTEAVPTARVEALNPAARTSQARQDVLREALARKPHAICLFVSAADTAQPGELREQLGAFAGTETLLVTIGAKSDDPRIYGHVGVDWPGGAERLGANLTRIAAGARSYILLHADGASPLATDCYRHFASAARREYDMVLLQDRNTANEPSPAHRVIEELLSLFPNTGLLVTLDPQPWLTAPPDWEHHLRTINTRLRFATLSADPPLWRYLGTTAGPGDAAALVGPLHGELGYAAMQMVTQALFSEREKSPERWIACELVMPPDLPGFVRRYAESAGGFDLTPYLRGGIPTATGPSGAP